jgi:hypothetical protein
MRGGAATTSTAGSYSCAAGTRHDQACPDHRQLYLSIRAQGALVFLDLEGIPYEIDPIVPFFGDDRFGKLSPVRRMRVLIDDLVTLTDSSVICQYLEDRYRIVFRWTAMR